MRNTKFRLGVRPASHYLESFDAAKLQIGGETASARVGEGDRAFEAHVPIEFGAMRTDIVATLRSALAQIVEMDDAVRAANPHDEEELAEIVVREFFVALRYWSATQNGDRTEYFTLADGRWRRRGGALPWMVDWPARGPGQIMALDAAYAATHAAAACVHCSGWDAPAPTGEFSRRMAGEPHHYASGEFYKRELPVLMALLDESPVAVSTLIIDGYVWLSGDGRPGLGARLYEALAREVRVIGVAKTKLNGDDWSKPVLRGESDAPLYITASGMDPNEAAKRVAEMDGPHRIPDLLKRADRCARAALA